MATHGLPVTCTVCQFTKVFCFFFSKKEALSSSLPHPHHRQCHKVDPASGLAESGGGRVGGIGLGSERNGGCVGTALGPRPGRRGDLGKDDRDPQHGGDDARGDDDD